MSKMIVKHNNFVEANYNLTLTELKIIAKLSSMIKKDDDNITSYRFSLQNLLEELNLGKENYTHLTDALDRLLTRIIVIKRLDSNAFLKTTFLSSTEYFLDDGTIELSFDRKLKPYLIQLKNNFTMYQFENVIALSSFYAIRIYELCKQYEKLKERIIEVDHLKEILDIKDKYKKYNDFKKYVLKIAEREINEKTDINISFEEIKAGRKVKNIRFLIKNLEKKQCIKNTTIQLSESKIYSDETLRLFKMLPVEEQIESSKDKLDKLLKNYTCTYLESDINYAKKVKPQNFWGYIIKSCDEGHYSKDEIKKTEKKKLDKSSKQIEQISYIDFKNMSDVDKEKNELAKKLMGDKKQLNSLLKLSQLNTLEEIEEFKKSLIF